MAKGPETPSWLTKSSRENPATFVPDRPVGLQNENIDINSELEALREEGVKIERPIHAVVSIFRLVELAHEQMLELPRRGFRKRKLPKPKKVVEVVKLYVDDIAKIRDSLGLPTPKDEKGYNEDEKDINRGILSGIASDDDFPTSASERGITDESDGLSVSEGQDSRRIARDAWRILTLSFFQNPDFRINDFITHDKEGSLLSDKAQDEMRKAMVVSYCIAINTIQMIKDIVDQLGGQYPDISETYNGIGNSLKRFCTLIKGSDGTLFKGV